MLPFMQNKNVIENKNNVIQNTNLDKCIRRQYSNYVFTCLFRHTIKRRQWELGKGGNKISGTVGNRL